MCCRSHTLLPLRDHGRKWAPEGVMTPAALFWKALIVARQLVTSRGSWVRQGDTKIRQKGEKV